MKVLFLTNQLDVGGIETNLVRLVGALNRRGHRCVVGARPGTMSDEASSAGASLVALGMSPRSLLSDMWRIRRVLSAERPDVVHVFSASSSAAAWMPMRLARPRPPLVASIMGLADAPDEPERRVRRRVRTTIAGADRIVVMAPAIAAVIETIDVAPERLVRDTVVGVPRAKRSDPTSQRSLRSMLGIGEGDEVVTSIGRIDPRKSHDLFVQGAALLSPRRPNARFLLVGDGALTTEIEAEVRARGLTDRVHMLGSRRDIDDILSITDVYVRPGVVEGFIGITVLEAQAMQVPVVSFRTADVQLAIEDGVTGLLADNGDVVDLAAKIERLLADPTMSEEIARNGHARFLERYELEGVVDRLEALYDDVASNAALGSR